MTARTLEAGGIATVIIGAAMDIVTWCGVPRFVYNDLPLGNPLGAPYDHGTQRRSVIAALDLLESATEPRVVETGAVWPGDGDWKQNYMKIDADNRESLKQMGAENRRKRRDEIERGLRRD